MASSNRHWPSLFKSKPSCNSAHHHQWQHDLSPNSLVSNGCLRASPFNSSGPGGGDERTPEPKPRWNPKPEQIRILEAIFNSGMVNPPRDEIRKIRAQLQEYGQVGDANVFYWFQNRKSRSKNKHRNLHHSPTVDSATAPSPTSSSSSEKSSSNKTSLAATTTDITNGNIIGEPNNYNYATAGEFFSTDPTTFLFHTPPQYTQGFSFSELSNVVSAPAVSGPSTNMLLTDLMSHGYNGGTSKIKDHHDHHVLVDQAAKMKMETQLMMSTYNTTVTSASPNHSHIHLPPSTTPHPLPSSIDLSQGAGEEAAMDERSAIMVFINDVAFQVSAEPFNFREAFGDQVVLVHSSGQPVLTNEWGDSLVSLQHGASYYLCYGL